MSLMNRLSNVKNIYQTPAKKVLCVCSAGLLRSPTAANVLHKEFGYNTRSAGCVKEFALIPVDEVLVEWADEIVCMEDVHAEIVKELPGVEEDNIKVLNIPDMFRWNDEELQKEIIKAYKDL